MAIRATIAIPTPSAVLELLKPITWFAPMWAFGCGVVSAGVPIGNRWPMVVAGVALAGPLVCATSQAVNDWFDRHVDAINEPHRPIPSGRIPGRWGLYIALIWTALSLEVAASLGPAVLAAAVVGLALAWAYSAPPPRLKRNGWLGNAAVALCYEGLPWFTGAAVMTGAVPDGHIILLAAVYSVGAHDRKMGIDSLPVLLGVERAARLACAVMTVPQIAVVVLLLVWGRPGFALVVGVLSGAQLFLMPRLLRQPRENAPWYNATGVTLYVIGMLVSAFAVRHLTL
jgi:chlorophyll synthase